MTLDGVHVRTIGEGVIGGKVYGVAANRDFTVVGCEGVDAMEVFMFDVLTGSLVRSLGKDVLTSCGGGIRFTPDGGHLLVAVDDCLSLFALSGEFIRFIGEGSLNAPTDVEFTPGGDVVVTDRSMMSDYRVCVLSSDGFRLLRTIELAEDSAEFQPDQFNGPAALAIHGGRMFVLDEMGSRVQVFQ